LKTAELPIDPQGDVSAEGIEFAPAWAIEILSPSQGKTCVIRNLTHCLTHGSQLGWLVLPRDRVVVVFCPIALRWSWPVAIGCRCCRIWI
jgi:Uma2 family endonuclease